MKHLAFSSCAATAVAGLAVLLAGGTATGAMAAVPSASASASASSAQQSTTAVPGAPMGLTAIPGDGLATLSWSSPASDGGSPVQEYVIEGGTSLSSSAIRETAGGHTATIGGLINGTTYYFSVHAQNQNGDGASVTVTVTPRARGFVPAGALPGSPTGLKISHGDGFIALSWSPPAPAGGLPVTRYDVYLGTNSSLLGAREFTTSGTSFRFTEADNGGTYFIKVAARNASGEGPGTPETSVTVTPPPPGPARPTGLTAWARHGEVILSWSPPKGGLKADEGYLIYIGTRSGHEGAKPAVPYLIENVTSYTSAPLKNGTRYYFQVALFTSAGDRVSQRSAEVSAVPGATRAGGGSGSGPSANPTASGNDQARSGVIPTAQPSLSPLPDPIPGQPTASSGLSAGLIVLLAVLALAAAAGGATAAMLLRRRRYDRRYGPVPAPRRPYDNQPTGQSSRDEEMNGPRYR
jgi:hypothetical protein